MVVVVSPLNKLGYDVLECVTAGIRVIIKLESIFIICKELECYLKNHLYFFDLESTSSHIVARIMRVNDCHRIDELMPRDEVLVDNCCV